MYVYTIWTTTNCTVLQCTVRYFTVIYYGSGYIPFGWFVLLSEHSRFAYNCMLITYHHPVNKISIQLCTQPKQHMYVLKRLDQAQPPTHITCHVTKQNTLENGQKINIGGNRRNNYAKGIIHYLQKVTTFDSIWTWGYILEFDRYFNVWAECLK